MSSDFMPSEAMITRPQGAPWERLVRGQRVTITAEGLPGAGMRVTDVIAHVGGDETYVLRDPAVTWEELAAEEAQFMEMLSSVASCGNCAPPPAETV